MTDTSLSQALRMMSERFGSYRDGVTFVPAACAVMSTALDTYARRAAELEQAEHQLAEMEAVARDLDVITATHRARLSAAVPGSNVVTWPIVPHPVPPTGGDAA